MPAKVYLIGAGPGDPDLLTIRGSKALAAADVVIYDYLSSPKLLAYARDDAELIFVGKKGFDKHITQGEINAILVEKAQQEGTSVVARLKGGDPFVFGRGGEEALALVDAGIPFEVIPGVTSGIAAPAYAGIPVTHRGLSSSVSFVTGNEDPTKPETSIDWNGIAHGAETLCFYMGIRNLPLIATKLMQCGRPADTPVALVRWGTMPGQEVLTGTLSDIAAKAGAAEFKAPAIIVVGSVVELRSKLSWFETRPLFGKRIALTRTRDQASSLSEKLAKLGADCIELPTIELHEPSSYDLLDTAIAHLSDYTWIVFTSANGVDAFFKRLALAGRDARALGAAMTCAIGPATAERLARHGIVCDLIPSAYRAESTVDSLAEAGVGSSDRILIPRAEVARDVLPDRLEKLGATVDVAPAYRTTPPAFGSVADKLQAIVDGELDALTFTSSSTVKNLVALLDTLPGHEGDAADLLAGVDLFSIGPITSNAARAEGLQITAEADVFTIDGLVDKIVETYSSAK